MPGKQAKILTADQIDDLLFFAETTRHPLRNRVIVLLSIKAGLRAAEIANLTWDMLLDPSGGVGSSLELRDCAAKMGSGRAIPLHHDLRLALSILRQSSSGMGPIVRSVRDGPMIPLSIVIWFNRVTLQRDCIHPVKTAGYLGLQSFLCSRWMEQSVRS